MKKVTLPNDVLLPAVVRLLEEGESVTLKVKGKSMLPFIVGERDSVVLQAATVSELMIGDIVLAKLNDSRYVLHRIIGLDRGYISLMGDGNRHGRETCRGEAIVGQVIRIIKKERVIDCTTFVHRRKVAIWKALLPIRGYLLAIYRQIN